jgi:hypothetical protein
MPTTIRYADILNYLTAIANKANQPIGEAPHLAWWQNLSYNDFKTGQIPNVDSVNIMDSSNPLQSAFYVILTNTDGYQGYNQMPDGGPYITDTNPPYSVTIDGKTISGAQIAANIESWLSNGFPE